MQTGRIVLYTDVEEITYKNVIDVLRNAMTDHRVNAARIKYLMEYDEGNQPLKRKKKVRTEIDCHCVDNVANEITEFWSSFGFGNPITLVQTGDAEDKEIAEGVKNLNKQYNLVKIKTKTQEIARPMLIGAICNVLIDVNTEWKPGKAYFTYDVLNPMTSFVIKSSYYADRRTMLGVTFRHDKNSGSTYYTCYSKDSRYEIRDMNKIINGDAVEDDANKWKHEERSGEKNPLGVVPIVEYFRSYDRMGVWERQISEMDNLNLMISDFSNDVDQNTQAIWHTNDVDFPTVEEKNEDGTVTESVRKPKSGEWMQTYTASDGKTPIVEALAVNYDYEGMLNNIQVRRQTILQKCNVPQRNDNSGGSTGVAMSDATGWSHAEAAASKQQMIIDSCKMEEVEVVLAAINASSYVPQDDPMRKLTIADLEPNIKRQKTYEMSTKVNAMATMLSHGFSLEDTTDSIPFFDDPSKVCSRSGEGVRKYQETIYKKNSQNAGEGGDGEKEPNSGRTMQDLSDQISNSPLIDKSRTDK
nr:MAG TPA: Portal [Bacteriophage sp.]